MNSTPNSSHKPLLHSTEVHHHSSSQHFGHLGGLYLRSDQKMAEPQPPKENLMESRFTAMNSPEVKLRNDYTKQSDTASQQRADNPMVNNFGGHRGNTMMLIVRNNESLDEGFSSVGQSQEGGAGQAIDDEMLLTRTEAGLSFQFGSNVCSTQKSISLPHGSVPGEFEKRISDIKARLTEIKNSINTTEVETKPLDHHLRLPSPVKRPSIFPYFHQPSVSSAYDLPQ